MVSTLKVLLSLSLSGTLLILVIFLLKPLWKDRLSKQWQYYIWLVVIARLLLPFAPETNFIGIVFEQFETNVSQSEHVISKAPGAQNQTEQVPIADNDDNGAKGELIPPDPGSPPEKDAPPLHEYVFFVWLAVALILFVRKITIYQGFAHYIRAGQESVDNVDVLNRFGILLSEAGIKRNIELAANPFISSPLFMGILRPCIVLPNAAIAGADFCCTIQHELTHYQRYDMIYKWLVQLTACIHWFNPLVYLMGREINHACELSCDEAVISHMNAQEKAAYGDTLLNAMEAGSNYKGSLASMTLHENKTLLKERLDAIMKFKKSTRLSMAISMIAASSLCFGAAAAGAYTVAPSLLNGDLSLVTKEYPILDMNSLHISGVAVDALSEDVSVSKGGDTLKVEYYIQSPDDYILQNETDGEGTSGRIVLRRTAAADNIERPISITIPENISFNIIDVNTASGNIDIADCDGRTGAFSTQNGQITINGGTFTEFFTVNTDSGSALISGTVLPVRGVNFASAKFHTDGGAIMFQPANSAWDYRYRLNAGDKAQIMINGKKYQGGSGNINNFSHSQIDVEIADGSFIVQDYSLGDLSLETHVLQTNATEDVSNWTEDEFLIFIQEQERKYKELLTSGDITQEEYNIFVSEDKEVLKEIRNGVKISKAATGSIENGTGYSTQGIMIEQIQTIVKDKKAGIEVSFSNSSDETIQDIFVRLKFPDRGSSTGVSADFSTKGDASWELNADEKSSYFWPFTHDNDGSFKMAITSYTTADGKNHVIPEDDRKWTEFFYPGKNNDSRELFTSYLNEEQHGKQYFVMNLTAGDPCTARLSWEGGGKIYFVYVEGIGFQTDKDDDIPLSQFSSGNADYFAYEIPNNEPVTFTIPKDGLYVVPVRDKSGNKTASNIVGEVSYYVY